MDFKNPENPKSNILDIEDLKKLGNKHKWASKQCPTCKHHKYVITTVLIWIDILNQYQKIYKLLLKKVYVARNYPQGIGILKIR